MIRPIHSCLAAVGAVALGAGAASSAQDTAGGTPSVAVSDEGRQVYEQICQSCHMADAMGGTGAGAAIPALAGNARLQSKDYFVTLVVKGRGGMPWFTDMLTEQQIAAVGTYVRAHFNDYPDPVTVGDVRRVIAGPAPVPDCDCTR